MRANITFEGSTRSIELTGRSWTVGRPTSSVVPEIDLSPDQSVSRRHARIWQEADSWWVEDLKSRTGTVVDGVSLKPGSRHAIRAGASIQMGQTTIVVDGLPASANASPDCTICADTTSGKDPAVAAGVVKFAMSLDEAIPLDRLEAPKLELVRLSHTVCGSIIDSEPNVSVPDMIVRTARELIPSASHAAILVLDQQTNDLLLACHEPAGDPRVSTSIANLAIGRRQAMIWQRPSETNVEANFAVSIVGHQIEHVMCVPMTWRDATIGVLWVTGNPAGGYVPADLALLVFLARQAGMAIGSRRQQDELEIQATIIRRVLTHFSPAVANRLLEQARHGRFRPGGSESEVTILCCDLRGFTRATGDMAAEDVVDMLNEYFSVLAGVLTEHGGTIDKYIGDAILAVFGSPEPDARQHERAVQAAHQMQARMRVVNERRMGRSQTALELGIGIHCGKVLHGFIGSEDRLEFTVIGEPVNKASRYCDGAKPGSIIVSPEVHQHVWRMVKARKIDIQTKHEGTMPAYEISL